MRISTGTLELIYSTTIIQSHNDEIKIEFNEKVPDELVIYFKFEKDEKNQGYRTYDNSEDENRKKNELIVTLVNCNHGNTGVFPAYKGSYDRKRFYISYHVIVEGRYPDILRVFTFNFFLEEM